MAESLQTYLTTKTWTRAEWEAAQTKGTEGGFVAYAQIKTPYEEYLKNAGFKDEAAAMAKRAEEDAAGTQFGEIQSETTKALLAERKITPEYAKELDDAQARARAEEAKRVALLSKGYITGQEPVYIPGTPENKAWWEAEIARAKASGTTPEPPDPYLDAQAFAARWDEYHRYGATSPTYKSYDATTNQFTELPNPFFNAQVLVPKVGMGNQWYKLERAKWATVGAGGRTAATEQAEYDLLNFFSRTAAIDGNPMPAGMRFFMRTPGDITNTGVGTPTPAGTADKTILSTVEDFEGNTITNYSDGSSTSTDSNGQITELSGSTSDDTLGTGTTSDTKAKKVSAYNQLYDEFNQYGVGSLVSDVKNILLEGPYDPADFALKVRGTKAYKDRFIANEARIAKGLRALSPASYVALEDQYQEVMRQYGLPASYYAKSPTGVQEGFNKLIENDISNLELEFRIGTAQERVINSNPEVLQALKQYYPDINNGDILAYVLDPANAKDMIKRKVTAAEIGGAAIQSGLGYKGNTPEAIRARAEELGAAGVTKQTAQEGFGMIAGGLQRGSQLAAIYGEDPYTQTTAETELFKLSGAQEARKKRQKVTGLEQATFGGKTGITSGALVRDRAGAY